ncbi:MAG: hypothetical protein KJO03_07265, partial [Gammaproteobacteria bacterium]|nr:hypothetical protein [Gammaproteobacteria bacterium]
MKYIKYFIRAYRSIITWDIVGLIKLLRYSYLLLALSFTGISSVHAKHYWEGSAGYFESLGQLCAAEADNRGGNAALCDVSGPVEYGTGFTGSCHIGLCDGIPLAYAYYTKELYTIAPPLDNNQPNMCVGNPIDPVTGNKFQKEHLLELEAIQPITFALFYNSNRLEKWRHSYSRTMSFSSTPNGPRFDFNGIPFGLDPVAQAESASGLGGEIINYGVRNPVPHFSMQYSVFTSEEQACETGWPSQRGYYHYSWAPTSVAEYRQKPVSSFGSIGQCYILDKPEAQGGQVKL